MSHLLFLFTGCICWCQRWWRWLWSCSVKAAKNWWWFLRQFVLPYFYHIHCAWKYSFIFVV